MTKFQTRQHFALELIMNQLFHSELSVRMQLELTSLMSFGRLNLIVHFKGTVCDFYLYFFFALPSWWGELRVKLEIQFHKKVQAWLPCSAKKRHDRWMIVLGKWVRAMKWSLLACWWNMTERDDVGSEASFVSAAKEGVFPNASRMRSVWE